MEKLYHLVLSARTFVVEQWLKTVNAGLLLCHMINSQMLKAFQFLQYHCSSSSKNFFVAINAVWDLVLC